MALRVAVPSARGSTDASGAVDEERDLERPPLRKREAGQHLVQHVLEQVAEPDVREALLRLGGPRLEDAEPHGPGMLDAVEPDRRLPDPGAALEHERREPGLGPVEKVANRRELRLPTDDLEHHRRHEAGGTLTSRGSCPASRGAARR
jgi:hypothetical protein